MLVVKNLPANAGDMGLIPGLGRSSGGKNGYILKDSCLENPMDRGGWWATVHGLTSSQTWWKQLSTQVYNVRLGLTVWRRQWQPTPVLLPGKSHGRRSLVGCSPWGCKESDTTEWLHFHVSLSCIREGNGNPFQCSCLENPRDGGAWWAAIYGITQS